MFKKKLLFVTIAFGVLAFSSGSQASAAGAKLYEKEDFAGWGLSFNEGRGDTFTTQDGLTWPQFIKNKDGIDIPNDKISSLTIDEGYRIILAENNDYKGRILTIENRNNGNKEVALNHIYDPLRRVDYRTIEAKSISNLSNYSMNDKTSSIIVEKIANDSTNPIVYENHGFGGRSQVLNVGDYRKKNLSFGNDRISSIRVPRGYTVQMWDDDKYKDRNYTFVGPMTVSYLEGFNDKVSSLKVWKN